MLKLFPARASLPEYIDKTAEYNGKHLLSALGTPAGRESTIASITEMLLNISDPGVIRKILNYLTISDLICIFLGIVGSAKSNDERFKVLIETVVLMLNSFPCVKLVDNEVACKNDPYSTSSLFADTDDYDSERVLDDDDDEIVFSESIKYQLSVKSIEYVRLLSHLETTHNTPKITFPLVEIKSRYLNAVSSFVEMTAGAIKIENSSLGILGPSSQLKNRLKVVTISGYENFHSLKEFNSIEKLIVYGNQVSVDDIRELIKSCHNLKQIYYKGRVAKFSDKMNCTGTETNIKTTYDLICLDRITPEIIDYCGDKNIIGLSEHIFTCNALSLNQNDTSGKPLERSIDLSVLLKSLPNLRKFQMNCLFEDGFISCACDSTILNSSLHYIDLSRCKFEGLGDFSGLPNIRSASFRNCSIDVKSISSLRRCRSLSEICFYDCMIYWNAALYLPPGVRQFVLHNIDVDQCKNILFASYTTETDTCDSSGAEMERLVGIDINSERSYLRIGCRNQLAIMKPGVVHSDIGKGKRGNSSNGNHTRRNNLKANPEVDVYLPESLTSISFVNYPNFESVDLAKIHGPQWSKIKEIDFLLYAYGNVWQKPLHLPNADSIRYKFHYVNVNTIGGERSELKPILSAESLDGLRSSTYSSEDEAKPRRRGRRRGPKPKVKRPVGRPRRRGRRPLRESTEDSEEIEVPIEDGKYVDRNVEDLSEFQKGYQGRRLPFPVAKHTAPPMATPEDPTKPYQCRFCKRSFDRRENFRRHSLIHTDYRPYVCPMCKKGFKRSDNLRSHMRVCHAANRSARVRDSAKRGRSKSREESVSATITDDSFRIISQPVQSSPAEKSFEETTAESPRKKLKLHRDHPSASPEGAERKRPGRPCKIKFEPTNLSLAISTPNPLLSKPKSSTVRIGGNCVQRLVKDKNSQLILKSIVPKDGDTSAQQQGEKPDAVSEKPFPEKEEKESHSIVPKLSNLLDSNAPSSPPGTSNSTFSNSTSGGSSSSRPDTKSSNTSGVDYAQYYQGPLAPSSGVEKKEGPSAAQVNLPKLKMFEFVPNMKLSYNSKGDRLKARGGFRPEQIGSQRAYDREIRFDARQTGGLKPQLLQTYSKRTGDHSKMLVFRMEKPQETVARHRREEERRARAKTNSESLEDQNPAGPSSEQMENRRRLIREKVNEAFGKCERTNDGHYVCFKCGKNFAKRGNVKRHLILHLDVDLYDCICGRTFQRSDNYKSHFLKCKKRRELGLPLSVDADDMQVVPRGRLSNLKGEIGISGDSTPGVTSSTLNAISSPDAYSTDSLSTSDNANISSNGPNVE
ncbi:hypothetical protein BRETT_000518 [Brettanomyces bruxellensis]|uniref:C2H2-type domain-containing protein n=1 Tax=Dekkera bruxellensis TaxID=5007 RepID=A0A871R7X0_DEKBR|nr:uncharacterized protein BRETT_000518 [Brettanomyces bruxellensis]QOU20804.1 hypothetical protein BRETT_000518 [Brettanomyces bruxellensis]